MEILSAIQNMQTLTCGLTGLPDSGKTTLASALANILRSWGYEICVLDGDELREGLSNDLGFRLADSEEQSRRAAELARLLKF